MKHTAKYIQKESILKNIAIIMEGHHEIVLAYVFGSFIHRDTFSDIDIGVLTNKDMRSCLEFEFDLEIEIENNVNYPVDVRVLNNAPLSFCQNVIRHGRVVLERNPNIHGDFMGKILKQYFEFAPFRRKYLQEILNAPI